MRSGSRKWDPEHEMGYGMQEMGGGIQKCGLEFRRWERHYSGTYYPVSEILNPDSRLGVKNVKL